LAAVFRNIDGNWTTCGYTNWLTGQLVGTLASYDMLLNKQTLYIVDFLALIYFCSTTLYAHEGYDAENVLTP